MTKVLYIEDNPLNMRLVQRHLKFAGLTMLSAIDGLSGLDIAQQEQADVILVDINLPDIDGLEVTRRLRAMPEFANTPIIALTANAMHGDREICLEAGCDAYLAKPIARQELYYALRSYVPDIFAATA